MARIDVREVAENERARYDLAVAKAPYPDFLQTWAWGDLKAASGWTPIRLLVSRGCSDVAAMSILERRLPLLGALHYAPRGPMVDWSDAEAVAACFDAAEALGKRRGAVALKVDPGVPHEDTDCRRALCDNGFQLRETGADFEGVQPRFVMQLRIAGRSTDDLLAAFHSKTRYNIRLAERRGVRVRIGERSDMGAFYDALRETAERDRFTVRARSYFEAMYDTCVATGLARLWLAESTDGDLLAGAIAYQLGGVTWYLYGASRSVRRDLMAPYAVQWAMIQWALGAGCVIYDFRGVSGDLRPESPLYGLYRFKNGFSATLVKFVGEWDRPYRPVRLWAYEHVIPAAREILLWRSRNERSSSPAERE